MNNVEENKNKCLKNRRNSINVHKPNKIVNRRQTIAISSSRETITVASKEQVQTTTIEHELRILLRVTKERLRVLSEDYNKVRRKNLELITKMTEQNQQMQRLAEQNKKYRIAVKTYSSNIQNEHNYA